MSLLKKLGQQTKKICNFIICNFDKRVNFAVYSSYIRASFCKYLVTFFNNLLQPYF